MLSEFLLLLLVKLQEEKDAEKKKKKKKSGLAGFEDSQPLHVAPDVKK